MSQEASHEVLSSSSLSMNELEYQYRPLNESVNEIRLLTLLPGGFDDTLKIEIHHIEFHPPSAEQENERERLQQALLESARECLPPGWEANRTSDGRLIFNKLNQISWDHPAPSLVYQDTKSQALLAEELCSLKYEALSYTWGNAEAGKAIQVQSSGSDARIIRVRHNLASALQHLRSATEPRFLWCDFICINQEDTPERNIQVKRMGTLYKNAIRTIAWLGPTSESTSFAFERMKYISDRVVMLDDTQELMLSPEATDNAILDNERVLPLSNSEWSAIRDLLLDTYFCRVWIVQELALAGSRAVFVCGSSQLKAKAFRTALYCLMNRPTQPIPGYIRAFMLVIPLFTDLSRAPFDWIIRTCLARLCSDPRDKVYALLSLAHHDIRRKIVIDYSQAIEGVYRDALLVICEVTGRINLLLPCAAHRPSISGPSWIPDLSKALLAGGYPDFSAGWSSCHMFVRSRNIIEVTGVRCCTVSAFKPINDPGVHGVLRLLRQLQQWKSESLDTAYPTCGSLLDAFVYSIHTNDLSARWPDNPVPIFAEARQDIMERVTQLSSALGGSIASNTPRNLRLEDALAEKLLNRDLIFTEEGYIGLRSWDAQPGDIVCTFLGCDHQLILRPLSHGQYIIVGDCYIHAFDDVNGFLGPLPSQWTVIMRWDTIVTGFARFYNSETGEETVHDPRLGPLPPEWEWIPSQRTNRDPGMYERFRNNITGEVMNSDPRMLPDALRARGVPLETFSLI